MVCEVYWSDLGAAVHLVRQYPCVFDVQRVEFAGRTSWSDPRKTSECTRMFAEVSQEYLNGVGILRDRPRKLLSTTESVAPRRSPGALLRAFSRAVVSS